MKGQIEMTFMDWLRVELLRLRSFDWGNGTKYTHVLKDGVIKFSSHYEISSIARKIGISDHDILQAIDSHSVLSELEQKAFTASWKEGTIILSWLEEGIDEYKTEIDLNYFEKDGKCFQKMQWKTRIVYLDGTDRIVNDMGIIGPWEITKDEYARIHEHIRLKSNDQTQ